MNVPETITVIVWLGICCIPVGILVSALIRTINKRKPK